MCRSIRTLHGFAPPATDDEVEAAALQYVRKISGSTHPARDNADAVAEAVEQVAAATRLLLSRLTVHGPPKDRDVEAAKARVRAAARYGTPAG